MHIIHIWPDRWECSCGESKPARAGGEATRGAYAHAEANHPSAVINRRLCSKKCIDDIPERALYCVSHDPECPQLKESD